MHSRFFTFISTSCTQLLLPLLTHSKNNTTMNRREVTSLCIINYQDLRFIISAFSLCSFLLFLEFLWCDLTRDAMQCFINCNKIENFPLKLDAIFHIIFHLLFEWDAGERKCKIHRFPRKKDEKKSIWKKNWWRQL